MNNLNRPRRRIAISAVFAYVFVVMALVIAFALGYAMKAVTTAEPIGKMASQPFVKMPEELP